MVRAPLATRNFKGSRQIAGSPGRVFRHFQQRQMTGQR
jgi:hypothetical protein